MRDNQVDASYTGWTVQVRAPLGVLTVLYDTILSGATHYTQRKEPNSTDDMYIFLLDMFTL